MKIKTLVLGQLQTNCYLVYDENFKEGIIIDPADSPEFIAEKIYQLKINPKAIIATHGHFDHILAAGELQLLLNKSEIRNQKFETNPKSEIRNFTLNRTCSGSGQEFKTHYYLPPFFIHKNDLFLLKQMNQSASYWLGYPIKKLPPLKIKFLKENDRISFGNFALKVIETPGHTPGGICLYASHSKLSITNYHLPILFSGDTLFKGTIGRYDFSYSSKEKISRSLKKLFKLKEKTVVYPGHGEKTTINNEKFKIIL